MTGGVGGTGTPQGPLEEVGISREREMDCQASVRDRRSSEIVKGIDLNIAGSVLKNHKTNLF